MTDRPDVFPETLEITPLLHPPDTVVRVPGSKSITNRALMLAALTCAADTPCQLGGCLASEDTFVMSESLQRLGFDLQPRWSESEIVVRRHADQNQRIPATQADLFVANSGTTMRFLTAMLSLGQGRYRLDGVPRMRERPIGDLLTALRQLGVQAASETGNDCPPVVLESNGLQGGAVRIRGAISSQFLSGLLMAAPFAQGPMTIQIDGPLVSRSYVTMTLAVLRRFGLRVNEQGDNFHIPGAQQGGVQRFDIEPDASAASYFFGAAAITGGRVQVEGLGRNSLQGDIRFVDVLARMGCHVSETERGLTVQGDSLRGVDVDMNDISDTVMTLAAVACFAKGPTIIRNVAHIRHKETDRLVALTIELRRLGAEVEEHTDGLMIIPRPLHGATVETYDDHRMAMSLALVGLRVPGVVIRNPACVSKTYPGFFTDLSRLRSLTRQ